MKKKFVQSADDVTPKAPGLVMGFDIREQEKKLYGTAYLKVRDITEHPRKWGLRILLNGLLGAGMFVYPGKNLDLTVAIIGVSLLVMGSYLLYTRVSLFNSSFALASFGFLSLITLGIGTTTYPEHQQLLAPFMYFLYCALFAATLAISIFALLFYFSKKNLYEALVFQEKIVQTNSIFFFLDYLEILGKASVVILLFSLLGVLG